MQLLNGFVPGFTLISGNKDQESETDFQADHSLENESECKVQGKRTFLSLVMEAEPQGSRQNAFFCFYF